jgi:hypothetical protein
MVSVENSGLRLKGVAADVFPSGDYGFRLTLQTVIAKPPDGSGLRYYPILSPESHLPLVDDVMLTLGLPIGPLTRFGDANLIVDRIVSNAALFYEASTRALQAAVDAANTAAPGRVALAAPPFTNDNAALAPDAWLFGIQGDLSPEDPVAAARRAGCNKCWDDPD